MKINGIGVTEAKKELVLHISEKDVKLGATKAPDSCAAALCCLRQPRVTAARIHAGRSYVLVDGKKWLRFKTSRQLRQEIIAFDRGGTFEPGTYTLKPLNEYERAVGRRQGSNAKGARDKGVKGKKAKKRIPPHQVAGIRPKMAVVR